MNKLSHNGHSKSPESKIEPIANINFVAMRLQAILNRVSECHEL